jgi:hypothetical protein
MEKSLYIHLGPHKTGTSAIQRFLVSNETMLSKRGLHYLKSFRWKGDEGHQPLALMLLQRHSKDYSSISGRSFVGQFDKLCKELKLELKSILDKSIIVSSETIPLLSEEAIDEFLFLFQGRSVKAIFYIRDIQSQALSLVAQIIKFQDSSNDHRIRFIYNTLLNNYYKCYVRILNILEKKIGKDNIIFKKYGTEYFKGGSIYTDFLDAVGLNTLEDFVIPDKLQNESLMYCETIYFKDLLNTLNLNTSQNIIVKQLFAWEKVNQGTKFFLPKDISIKIEMLAARIHKYLIANYLDPTFEEIYTKKVFDNEMQDYTLSYKSFTNLLDYLDNKIDGFKEDLNRSMMRSLERTYDYELKMREFEDTLVSFIKKSNRVALWGCGAVADKLFKIHDCLKDANICVIDNNSEKQGSVFWGHEILSPAAIVKKDIDTVIITSVAYGDDICKEIREKYINVKKIIKVSGLHIQIGIECIDF